jgi:molecular chaperone GrpE
MLQRTILRASRQRIAAFAPLRQPLVTARVATTPALRWYSDAPAAKEGEAAEKKKEDAAATPANDEAAKLKTEMEKKDKEIVELKVHTCNYPRTGRRFLTTLV